MGAMQGRHAARAAAATPEDRHRDAARHAAPRALSDADRADAACAWRGVRRLEHPDTGVAAAADGCPGVATPFTLARQIDATRAAHRLGLVPNRRLGRTMARLLDAAEALPRIGPGLPEFAFDPATLAPVRPGCGVTGWSAIAVLALADAVDRAGRAFPTFRRRAGDILAGWRLDAAVGTGGLVGCIIAGGQRPRPFAEGRLGHEQAAAMAAARLGLDAAGVPGLRKVARRRWWNGIAIVADGRAPDGDNPQSVITADGALDQALVLGWSRDDLALAAAQLEAARQLYLARGTLVVPGEIGHAGLSGAGVLGFRRADPPLRGEHGDGRPWPHCPPVAVGTSAAFRALFPVAFAGKLWDTARAAATDHGFAAGLLADGTPAGGMTVATNARVLLALSARAHGPLDRPAG